MAQERESAAIVGADGAQAVADQEFHCPTCGYGPDSSEEVLVHIITNHDIE